MDSHTFTQSVNKIDKHYFTPTVFKVISLRSELDGCNTFPQSLSLSCNFPERISIM